MTETEDPRVGAGNAAVKHKLDEFSELFRSGLVLVVHESGMACSKYAQTLIKQCEDRGIRCEMLPIEQVDDLEALIKYTGLFLVLPAPTGGTEDAAVLAHFEAVYAFYRERKPQGLTSILTAGHPWWFAGPVHAYLWGYGPDDVNPFPAQEKPCVVRYFTDPTSLGDIFEDYRPPPFPPGFDANQYLLENGVKYWKLVRDWGVQTLAESDAIYELIEARRAFYDNPIFPKLSKPRKTGEGNRLDQVLQNPDQKFDDDDLEPHQLRDNEAKRKARKAYKESGAKVVRETLKVIRAKYPHVTRPDERTNTKDNQKAFKDLYDATLALHTLPADMRYRVAES
ncbi:hypothetical protein [Lentzea terrae]|uniref:hypothetical protein n=1 Tax=Lentzea terrae TaxID=2200761 RepID=UPI00130028A1|nr:hypothetical protein [Lentzea terrae]